MKLSNKLFASAIAISLISLPVMAGTAKTASAVTATDATATCCVTDEHFSVDLLAKRDQRGQAFDQKQREERPFLSFFQSPSYLFPLLK